MINERTLTNLRNTLNGKIYVYLSNKTVGQRFMENAKKEGFRFGKATPTQCNISDLIALGRRKQLCYVGFVGRIALQCNSVVSEGFCCIDYEKYINGDEFFFFSKKPFTLNSAELRGKFYGSVMIVGDNCDKAASEIQKRIADIDSPENEEKLYDEISENFDVSISEE